MSRAEPKPKARFSKKKNRRLKSAEEREPSGVLQSLKQAISFGLSIAAIAGFGVGAFYGWQSLNNSPRLQVKGVSVEGIDRISREEVDVYVGDVFGKSILELDLDTIAFEIRRHPWIADVTVRRKLPDSLIVKIHEHEPVIFVSLNDVYVANREGYLFKRLSSRDGLVFPVLTGMDLDATDLHSDAAKAIVQDAIEIVAGVEKHEEVFGRVEEIHFDSDLGWSAVSRPPGKNGGLLRVHLGNTAIRRITVAKDVLSHLRKMSRDPEVIWVDFVKNPDRVHVRLRTARSMNDADRLIASAR